MLVFHIDANSAYLSWTAVALLEEGYSIDIRKVPAVISGNPENRHGIILAKSIPAKRYDIKTGESLFEAMKKCPKPLIFSPDYDLYLSCSEAMYKLLYEYTPVIQRYSIDECFCDMTACEKAVDEIRKTFGERSIFRGRFANTEIDPVQGGINGGNYIMMRGFKS